MNERNNDSDGYNYGDSDHDDNSGHDVNHKIDVVQ